MGSDSNVIPISRASILKANPALPDHVFDKLQGLGEKAVEHLERLITDPRFVHFPIKEQMKIIDAVMLRAYGAPDGSVRRNVHFHTSEDAPGTNALRGLANKARKDLPEFKSAGRRTRQSVQDAVIVEEEEGGA